MKKKDKKLELPPEVLKLLAEKNSKLARIERNGDRLLSTIDPLNEIFDTVPILKQNPSLKKIVAGTAVELFAGVAIELMAAAMTGKKKPSE